MEWNGMEWNGMEWNGMEWNGMEWYGMEWNGKEWNGMEWNGMEWNGMEWNGMEWNGMEWNGMEWNGMEWNGMEWNGNEVEGLSVGSGMLMLLASLAFAVLLAVRNYGWSAPRLGLGDRDLSRHAIPPRSHRGLRSGRFYLRAGEHLARFTQRPAQLFQVPG